VGCDTRKRLLHIINIRRKIMNWQELTIMGFFLLTMIMAINSNGRARTPRPDDHCQDNTGVIIFLFILGAIHYCGAVA
jgi:hypothetical protein